MPSWAKVPKIPKSAITAEGLYYKALDAHAAAQFKRATETGQGDPWTPPPFRAYDAKEWEQLVERKVAAREAKEQAWEDDQVERMDDDHIPRRRNNRKRKRKNGVSTTAGGGKGSELLEGTLATPGEEAVSGQRTLTGLRV